MQVEKVGTFIKQSLELRTGDSSLFLTCIVYKKQCNIEFIIYMVCYYYYYLYATHLYYFKENTFLR